MADKFREMIGHRLGAIYYGMHGDNPTILYQFSHAKTRTTNLSHLGEVNNPSN